MSAGFGHVERLELVCEQAPGPVHGSSDEAELDRRSVRLSLLTSTSNLPARNRPLLVAQESRSQVPAASGVDHLHVLELLDPTTESVRRGQRLAGERRQRIHRVTSLVTLPSNSVQVIVRSETPKAAFASTSQGGRRQVPGPLDHRAPGRRSGPPSRSSSTPRRSSGGAEHATAGHLTLGTEHLHRW